MLLFKPEHVEPILRGEKTQTRRIWNMCRAKVGALHGCYTKPPWGKGGAEPFAHVRIYGVRQEPLSAISEADAVAEGYLSRARYFDAFERINGHVDRDALVWVVEFHREHQPVASRRGA